MSTAVASLLSLRMTWGGAKGGRFVELPEKMSPSSGARTRHLLPKRWEKAARPLAELHKVSG